MSHKKNLLQGENIFENILELLKSQQNIIDGNWETYWTESKNALDTLHKIKTLAQEFIKSDFFKTLKNFTNDYIENIAKGYFENIYYYHSDVFRHLLLLETTDTITNWIGRKSESLKVPELKENIKLAIKYFPMVLNSEYYGIPSSASLLKEKNYLEFYNKLDRLLQSIKVPVMGLDIKDFLVLNDTNEEIKYLSDVRFGYFSYVANTNQFQKLSKHISFFTGFNYNSSKGVFYDSNLEEKLNKTGAEAYDESAKYAFDTTKKLVRCFVAKKYLATIGRGVVDSSKNKINNNITTYYVLSKINIDNCCVFENPEDSNAEYCRPGSTMSFFVPSYEDDNARMIIRNYSTKNAILYKCDYLTGQQEIKLVGNIGRESPIGDIVTRMLSLGML